MTFLSPLAWLWIGSVPVLMWLWRMAASAHQTVVPSLVPFEHLLRRQSTRRTRLIVNLLFWLQLAFLCAATLALAQPMVAGHRSRTTLVILDTSASMQTVSNGRSRWHDAVQRLAKQLDRKASTEQIFLVTTAPVSALTPQPLAETAALQQLVRGLKPTDMAGNLSVAHRIGRALLAGEPDRVLVVTDEPKPESVAAQATPVAGTSRVEFESVGGPQPNVAIVGLDAREPLCAPTTSQLVVSALNASDAAQPVTITVSRHGVQVARTTKELAAGAREPVSIDLPEPPAPGLREARSSQDLWFDVTLEAAANALAVDDHARVNLYAQETIPVVVASSETAFLSTMTRWLDACPRVASKTVQIDDRPQSPQDPDALVSDIRGQSGQPPDALLITDRPSLAQAWPGPVMAFAARDPQARPVAAQWLVDAPNEIAEFLAPLEVVATTLAPGSLDGQWGDPAIWAVVQGQRVPLVRTAALHGRRVVSLLFDPSASASSRPPVLVFLNSLRWLTASRGMIGTGEPILAGPFQPGVVRVTRPDGRSDEIRYDGGLLDYHNTDAAGLYRLTQGGVRAERAANFLDPVESDTRRPLSTWIAAVAAPSSRAAAPSRRSLVHPLLQLLVVLLVAEWVWYAWRDRVRRAVTTR